MGTKVLIADDEPNIVVSLSFMMKREGYDVLVARDGTQALAMIRAEKPRLVLLDAMMPGMTGFDVCEAVRADDERPRHPHPDADARRAARATSPAASAPAPTPT